MIQDNILMNMILPIDIIDENKFLDFKFGKTSDNLLDDIYNVDLLIIDDLGTETRSDYKITELFNIINSSYNFIFYIINNNF